MVWSLPGPLPGWSAVEPGGRVGWQPVDTGRAGEQESTVRGQREGPVGEVDDAAERRPSLEGQDVVTGPDPGEGAVVQVRQVPTEPQGAAIEGQGRGRGPPLGLHRESP